MVFIGKNSPSIIGRKALIILEGDKYGKKNNNSLYLFLLLLCTADAQGSDVKYV